MTQPNEFEWALNDNHAAGGDPWSGQPNKVAPPSGDIQTGWIPEELPPAEYANYHTNLLGSWTKWLRGIQVRNWLDADYALVSPGTDWTPDGAYGRVLHVAGTRHFSAADKFGDEIIGEEGVRWTAQGSGAGTLRALVIASGYTFGAHFDMACDHNGNRVFVGNPDATSQEFICYFDSITGTWSDQSARGAQFDECCVAHDGVGTWVMGNNQGDMQYTSDPSSGTWTLVSAVYAGNTVHVVEHTRDPDNSYFLAVAGLATNVRVLKSVDGITWAVHDPGVIGPTNPGSLAYDRRTQRWIMSVRNVSGNLYYSDDHGLSWTRLAGVTPWAGSTAKKYLACDGNGVWIVGEDLTVARAYYSLDGLTWTRINYPWQFRGGITFGLGGFTLAGYLGGHRSLVGADL
jgi:hypothetical protein